MRAPEDYLHMNVRLADFGEAQRSSGHNLELIQPDDLRAPEVILETGWGPKADIWSLACVVSSCCRLPRMTRRNGPADYHMYLRSGSCSNQGGSSMAGFLQLIGTRSRVICGKWSTISDLHPKTLCCTQG
jgi:serine/threonine protein kinase